MGGLYHGLCSFAALSCIGVERGPGCGSPPAGRMAVPAGCPADRRILAACLDVQVVSIFSADSPAGMLEVVFEWNDVFDIDIHPAVSSDEGLQIGPEVFGRLSRMQQG